ALAEAELLREQIDSLRAREQEVLAAAAQKAEGMLSDTLQQATRLRRTATQEPAQRSKALEEIQELRRQARRLSGAASRGSSESSSRAGTARGAGTGAVVASVAGQAVADKYAPGALVRVESYGAEGQVLERRGDLVLVQVGLLKVEVPLTDATPVVNRSSKAATGSGTGSRVSKGQQAGSRRVQFDAGAASFESELNIRGERVEQALEKTRDFISEARALKVESVRILHGKGTGVLRDAVRSYLKSDRNVLSYEDAVPYEGGHGVTVAHLRP
ncbi:MAG TPA: Smr/MutS family protein, partial [Trueperaceae bacterium]|nr:Smr/MutS family protein [Trueperaceae bacterium]